MYQNIPAFVTGNPSRLIHHLKVTARVLMRFAILVNPSGP
jgi:hypothetical protein